MNPKRKYYSAEFKSIWRANGTGRPFIGFKKMDTRQADLLVGWIFHWRPARIKAIN